MTSLPDVFQVKLCVEEKPLNHSDSSNPCVKPIKKHFYEGCPSPVYFRREPHVGFEIYRQEPDSDVEVRSFRYSFIFFSYVMNQVFLGLNYLAYIEEIKF